MRGFSNGGSRSCKPAKPRNLNNLLLLLVAKVESGKVISEDYRVCLDARPLNAKNWSKQFTLPKISDIIEKATKVTMMADLDLKGAFHQVLLDEVSSELSAFTDLLTGERYQMTNMWFGESGSETNDKASSGEAHARLLIQKLY